MALEEGLERGGARGAAARDGHGPGPPGGELAVGHTAQATGPAGDGRAQLGGGVVEGVRVHQEPRQAQVGPVVARLEAEADLAQELVIAHTDCSVTDPFPDGSCCYAAR